ncbi:unnamed protein product [Diatraea saccharalis]|uniref:Uncharacterized protein n=1 Tax=Diatraea saccharalis TaxID=40085 RepID=A0A9N9RCB8_9NEOP|nr:unnamed protein product [Diatraea saccharalis]
MSQIIFKKINEVDPNNSEAVKDVLATFFQHLSKHSETNSSKWLRTLEDIIIRYPKYCGSHRNTIELYLSKFVDSTDFVHVIAAAKCAHAIQQVRSPQEKSATAKACWKEHLIVLINIAHKLISELFPNTVDMYKDRANSQKPQFQTTVTSPLYSAFTQMNSVKSQNATTNKQHLLSTKLKNVFMFLQAMLVLGANLIPFSELIFKFIIQTLNWTTDNPSEESSVARWLRCVRAHRLRGGAREHALAAHLLADVAPPARLVQLTVRTHRIFFFYVLTALGSSFLPIFALLVC